MAVPFPTDPPFTTSTTFRKVFSSTTSLTVLSACATRLLKLRDEILLCSSWYLAYASATHGSHLCKKLDSHSSVPEPSYSLQRLFHGPIRAARMPQLILPKYISSFCSIFGG